MCKLAIAVLFLVLFCTVKVSSSDECGVPSKSIGLIFRGQEFTRGKWPWTVALMLREDDKDHFICAGVLISKKKVLTAAHCIHPKQGLRTRARDLLLLFGLHDINKRNENGIFSSSPSEVIIHPDWNPFNQRYDADIAAILLNDEVPFTTYIRPICIGMRDLKISEGYVTGWGKSEDESKPHENIPKELKVPIWTNEHCFLESPEFSEISSLRTFCAGSRDGSGVCNGDSGGGLFIISNGIYYLKGIISASLLKESKCDVSNFAIYTNVASLVDWIEEPSETMPSRTEEPDQECGTMSSSAGLIQSGKKSTAVQWPWAVVIFNDAYLTVVENKTYKNFEVGTLISAKFVIADGFFMSKDQDGKRVPHNVIGFKFYFGVIDIEDFVHVNSLILDGADKIILHPKLGNDESLKFANFALLKLKTSVSFSEHVSPICLSTFNTDPYSLTGRFAYAVGMGYSETGKTRFRNHAPMRIRNKEVCDEIYAYSLNATKDRRDLYFCAGGDGGPNACWSDHPLYMKTKGKWYLHAFLQVAFNKDQGCQNDHPVLYEIAGVYYNWIRNQMRL